VEEAAQIHIRDRLPQTCRHHRQVVIVVDSIDGAVLPIERGIQRGCVSNVERANVHLPRPDGVCKLACRRCVGISDRYRGAPGMDEVEHGDTTHHSGAPKHYDLHFITTTVL
jgi:hypothetical protein